MAYTQYSREAREILGMQPSVTILIPTLNRPDDLERAKASIDAQTYTNKSLVVFNNGYENVGVCRATNLAAQVWHSDYYLLMDNDCILISPNLIEELVLYMELHKKCAAVCPRHEHNASNTHSLLSERSIEAFVQNYYGIDDPYDEANVGLFYGTTVLIRGKVWRELDGFDESYFAYCQENELSARMVHAGYSIHYYPGVLAYHNLSRSARSPDGMVYYCLRNMLWFYTKYLPWHLAILNGIKWCIIFGWRGRHNIRNLLLAGRDAIKDIHIQLQQRKSLQSTVSLQTYSLHSLKRDIKLFISLLRS